MKPSFLASAALSLAAIALPVPAFANALPEVAPEIVSGWRSSDGNSVILFQYDGIYRQIQDSATDPGMEKGTFSWRKATGVFSAVTQMDTNGPAGLSHPAGAVTVSISGNTLTKTVAGAGATTFTRIVGTASPIVGCWVEPASSVSLTFLADGTYFATEEDGGDEIPFSYDGMERGTYSWNATTHLLTATPLTDTNGESGLSHLPTGTTVTISGNVLTIDDGEDADTFQRLVTNPTPLPLPDFDVTKYGLYRQTTAAGATAVALDIDEGDYPFEADVQIRSSVGATAPTFKIGAGAATPFETNEDDDEVGAFELGSVFFSLSALNAYLPTATNLEFKSGAGIASLTFAAAAAFPTVPAMTTAADGAWDDGVFYFDEDEVLHWTAPVGFDPLTNLTSVHIEDDETGEPLVEQLIQGEVTQYDLSGKMLPDHRYWVELEFYKIAGKTTAGTGVFTGKQGYALLSRSTEFLIQSATPESLPNLTILTQPANKVAAAGSDVIFSFGVYSDHLQWYKNGVLLPGQTGSALALFNIDAADIATYSVTATNGVRTVTSNGVTLTFPGTVPSAQTITFAAIANQTPNSGPSLAVSGGLSHSLFLKNGGIVWAAGNNSYGQLATGDTSIRSVPVPVMSSVSALSTSFQHSLFVKSDGTAWAAGRNSNGQLGTGDNSNRTTAVQVMTGVAAVSSGEIHSLFLKTDGTVWATGANDSGQLGTGNTVSQSSPTQVMTGVAAIAAGPDHSLFLKTNGTVWAVGANTSGQLGAGDFGSRTSPVQVLTGVASISAGDQYSLFVKTDGTAWGCGINSSGQLGLENSGSKSTPVQLMTGVARTETGADHSLFLKTDGSVWTTGENGSGQLGIGAVNYTYTPTQVITGVAAISGGQNHSLFLKTDGTLWGAGANGSYQLGIGTTTNLLTPAQIFQAATATTLTLTATTSSNLPITYVLVSGPATLSGNILTLTGVGTVVIRATQPGNALFTAATSVDRTFTVALAGGDPFLQFLITAGVPVEKRGANDDPDNDGVANLLEYLLGGNPTVANTNILPTFATTPISGGGRNLIFKYKRNLAASAGVTQVVEHSANLLPPWSAAVPGQNGVSIATAPVDSSTEEVTVTIPSADGKRFARLKATR